MPRPELIHIMTWDQSTHTEDQNSVETSPATCSDTLAWPQLPEEQHKLVVIGTTESVTQTLVVTYTNVFPVEAATA